MSRKLRVAVIGAGKMGAHHARTYRELPECELIAVVDRDGDRARALASSYGAAAATELVGAAGALDAASVCVPTVYHEEVSIPLLERGVAVLVEKPLAHTLESARRIREVVARTGRVLQVGHSERFNPVVQAMLRLNMRPRFVETHRISPFTFRSADISVVADMMIHDIDIILHLARQREYTVDAVGVRVLGMHADVANARVRFGDGMVANLTASRLALKTERKIRVFSPSAYLSMDYQKRSGVAVQLKDNLGLIRLARQKHFEDLSQMQNLDFGSMLHVEPLDVEEGDPLQAELGAFLESVRTGAAPPVTVEDGLAAVEMAERVEQAIGRAGWELGEWAASSEGQP